jgi:hypothetical protein
MRIIHRHIAAKTNDACAGRVAGRLFAPSKEVCGLAIKNKSNKIKQLNNFDYGTGSKPPGCSGWQRNSLLAARYPPFITPYLSTASYAYSEQLG